MGQSARPQRLFPIPTVRLPHSAAWLSIFSHISRWPARAYARMEYFVKAPAAVVAKEIGQIVSRKQHAAGGQTYKTIISHLGGGSLPFTENIEIINVW